METINGKSAEGTAVEVNVEQLQSENAQLKEICNKLYQENINLKQGWVLQRFDCLTKAHGIIKDVDTKIKIEEEIINILFPKTEEPNTEE